MKFSEYQARHTATDLSRRGIRRGLSIAVLGLISEAGSIANVLKKRLRDGISTESQREFIAIELGDVLWYLTNVATRLDLNLETIAQDNLARTEHRHGTGRKSWNAPDVVKRLDAGYPDIERFPDVLVFRFEEKNVKQRTMVSMSIIGAHPNPFPKGRIKKRPGDKGKGFTIGDPLSNNSHAEDGYRYHDVFHIGFMTVLGWSPVLRSLLRLKRKSRRKTDEVEDGRRASDVEEGLSTYLAKRAPKLSYFETPRHVDNATIDYILEHASGLEVTTRPAWLWKEAISRAFNVWKQIVANRGGYVVADLRRKTLVFARRRPRVSYVPNAR